MNFEQIAKNAKIAGLEMADLSIDVKNQALSVIIEALEQNKDKILQAGMEGREIDFRIGGRLFAIREKAQ